MLFSHHSHSGEFCAHASGTLEDVVLAAIAKGFTTYGLTEHVPRFRTEDLYPEETVLALTPAHLAHTFAAFLAEAHRLKALYAPRITLLVGLETELITPRDITGLQDLLARCGAQIEYIVGSVHHAGTVPIDFDVKTTRHAVDACAQGVHPHPGLAPFLCAYFDAQYTLLQTFHPEVVGHIDVCRLFLPALLDANASPTPTFHLSAHPTAWAKLTRNVAYAAEYGALFELNAAAFRKGWTEAYPAYEVVQLIKSHNGRFTLSDDAHGPHAVGGDYDRLRAYVQQCEIKEMWYLAPRGAHERTEEEAGLSEEEANKAGRRLVPVRAEGDWTMAETWGNV